ncbi:MAG: ArgE/DapE family deacylase [Alphaproteobacteria bacterium]|jgi:acetylornithine deacetylase|nr:ArgE/DapE family deacylase [Alphaproteobacteria bacterium]MDP6811735.1 ArgE/DapE family deacylase [Alphaproteobacteria bacterium]
MLDGETTSRIRNAVDEGFDEQLQFTAELVKFPSRRGQEHTAQDFMAREMRERGLAVDRWRIDVEQIRHLPGFSPVHVDYDNAYNVVGSHRPEGPKGRSLILNGHIDVVPEGPHEMWSSPPYQPRIDGDWMYGRGAGDMKAGLTGTLFALQALRRIGLRPAADVFVQSVVEEECTGNGALACLARGYRAEAALIPEPMGDALVRAQIGVIWLQIKVQGIPVHVATADTGSNAIDAAFALIQGLKELEAKWNAEKAEQPHYAEHHHPINFNVGKIAGGDWASSVPSWCVFDLRVAIYPGDDIDSRRAELEDCIRRSANRDAFLRNAPPQVTYNGFLAEGYELVDADEAEAALGRAHLAAYETPLTTQATTATTDARFFGLYANTPGLVYGPLSEAIHGFDERVNLTSVRRNTGAIALFIAEWCGLEAA